MDDRRAVTVIMLEIVIECDNKSSNDSDSTAGDNND